MEQVLTLRAGPWGARQHLLLHQPVEQLQQPGLGVQGVGEAGLADLTVEVMLSAS